MLRCVYLGSYKWNKRWVETGRVVSAFTKAQRKCHKLFIGGVSAHSGHEVVVETVHKME